jgi:AI-2 transport protein TqsA
MEPTMTETPSPQFYRLLQAAACVVIVVLGIRTASHLITVLLIALLLAYCAVPFPKWLIRRFAVPKTRAIALTIALWILGHVFLTLLLTETIVRMKLRLPIYEEHLRLAWGHAEVFLRAHGYDLASLTGSAQSSPATIMKFVEEILPVAIGALTDRFLIGLLSLLFLIEMAEHPEIRQRPIGKALAYYGADTQGFVVVMAKTGAITALANLVLLIVVGVDFPVLWCVLYFFLHFIPDIGIVVSVVPPTLIALLMLGWKSALVVLGGILFTNSFADYVLKPRFMQKEAHLSFLGIMLSLMIWGFLLGAWGGILAIPLTLSLRKFIEQVSTANRLVGSAAAG